MLQRVDVGPKLLERYRPIVGDERLRELQELARPLRGKRVAQINATSYGGGVSELLRSLVPLYRALGIPAEWLVTPGKREFFETTKAIHNGLQGATDHLDGKHRETYIRHSRELAAALEPGFDYVIVHDPQPAALRHFRGPDGARWVWRCHIDTSAPDPEVLAFLAPFIADYEALVFTMDEFVPAELRSRRYLIIPPGIDPLSPKNMAAPPDFCNEVIEWQGVDLSRPLISQISRFDRWKDPLGVIAVYRRAQHEIPGLQLALLGQMALDDPEGWDMYHDIVAETGDNPDIHVLTNFTGIGNLEVNAFQHCSDVVLQKSIREGFGLVVSETLWKSTPLVAGRTGGIPMQMPDGTGGYLVDSADECVEKTILLLRDPQQARRLAALGRARVQEHFLITRLLADELRLLASL